MPRLPPTATQAAPLNASPVFLFTSNTPVMNTESSISDLKLFLIARQSGHSVLRRSRPPDVGIRLRHFQDEMITHRGASDSIKEKLILKVHPEIAHRTEIGEESPRKWEGTHHMRGGECDRSCDGAPMEFPSRGPVRGSRSEKCVTSGVSATDCLRYASYGRASLVEPSRTTSRRAPPRERALRYCCRPSSRCDRPKCYRHLLQFPIAFSKKAKSEGNQNGMGSSRFETAEVFHPTPSFDLRLQRQSPARRKQKLR